MKILKVKPKEYNMITDYEYVISNEIEFKKIRDGDTFELHNTLYVKIPCVEINSEYGCRPSNSIRIYDLHFTKFDDSVKVSPVDSKLFIYK